MMFPGGDQNATIRWLLETVKKLRKDWEDTFSNGELRAASVANGVIITSIGGDPSTPAAGTLVLYGKADGGVIKLFVKYSDGTVVGPLT